MRKIILLLAAFFCVYVSNAQVSDADKNAALQLVNANRNSLGFNTDEINNLIVSSSYRDNNTGIRYAYLQQTYEGIPVYNQMLVITFRNDKVLSVSGDRIAGIEQKTNVGSLIPTITAESAVLLAISDRDLNSMQTAVVIDSKDNGRFVEFGDMGVSRENITVQLMWVPDDKGKFINLAWQVYIIPTTTSDYWLVRINATNGSTLGIDNLTVYCNWDDPDHTNEFGKEHHHSNSTTNDEISAQLPLADNGDYRVVPFPAEAPSFPLGAHAIRTNPWTAGSANAITLKWHSTDATGTDYNYTRGNNVWAYHDRTNLNVEDSTRSATSTTALPNLTFNFTPDYSQAATLTTPPNQQFNITNLFYWNNIIHNIMYDYGFNEVSGNFQANNLGRGGLGNDYVRAEAQDGSGTNNANFSTPVDGSKPRMQMFLWTAATPSRDSDVDNGVIVHEYGHGISNRLTGGPGNSSCLQNTEQMGEGWSDYYALMFTQDWATANLTSGFTTPRGIGTYLQNQSPSGSGIRTQRYSTDFSVNNRVYAQTLSTSPHNRGEIWCATLWDMTWNIIQQSGVINPNIYDLAGGGGNNIAMKLVTEGLKLQPCSPGFIDGRNAILQADINLYGGAYQCAIKEAFRRRGMGDGASQGSSNSVSDQIPSFVSTDATLTLLQNGITSTPEGQNINYSNRLVLGNCSPLVNYLITDTLPTNVTFVSATNGGTYNAGNRVVSWVVNQAINTTVNYNFTVSVNSGAYYAPITLLNETVSGATIPASWTTTASPTANLWTVSSTQSKSPPNSFFTSNLITVNDQLLATTNSLALTSPSPKLSFWGFIDSEFNWDGGVVEISTNGGSTWTDLGANITSGGYNRVLFTSSNPLAGRMAFTGNSGGFVKTTINLAPYTCKTNVKFRFRFASDDAVAGTGWYVDDILLDDIANVSMRSSLFNASFLRFQFSDSSMVITAPPGCTPPLVNCQPVNASVCTAANTIFTVGVVGTGPFTYQWQESTTGAGGPWNNITNGGIYSGALTSTLTLTGVTIGMHGYQYRCIITGQCTPAATSDPAVLNVYVSVNAGTVSGTSQICAGTTTTYTSNGTGGGNWSSTNLSVATVNAVTGVVTAVTVGTANITYTVEFSGCGSPVSSFKTLTVVATPVIYATTATPATICSGSNSQLQVSANLPACRDILITEVSGFETSTIGGTGAGGGGTISPAGIIDPIEITNISSGPVDISGWKLQITGTSPNAFIIPAGNVVPAGATFVLSRGSSGGAAIPGVFVPTPLEAIASNTSQGIILSTGSIIKDVVAINGGTPINPVGSGSPAVTSADWSGTVPSSSGTAGIRRTVASDGNIATDWTVASVGNPINIGVVNMVYSFTLCPLTYLWSPSTFISGQTTLPNPVATAATATTVYSVQATDANGCIAIGTTTLTVNPNVSAGIVSGTSPLCVSNTATYTSNGTAGGTWSSTNTSVATVNASTGLVTALSNGTTDITYTISSGCGSPVSSSKTLTVSSLAYQPVKTFLHGAYNSSLGRHKNVTTTWANILNTDALNQPYNIAPFNYSGTESVSAGFFTSTAATTDIVDWVLIELRDAASPSTVHARRAAFIREDGLIVEVDGVSGLSFSNVANGNYFLVIRHRNHLAIRSATVITLNSSMCNSIPPLYDFSISQSQAFQNITNLVNPAQRDLTGGVFGMWGGNGNSDGQVRVTGLASINDFLFLMNALGNNPANIFSNVYSRGDLNMDGSVRASGLASINDYLFLLSAIDSNPGIIVTQHQ